MTEVFAFFVPLTVFSIIVLFAARWYYHKVQKARRHRHF